MIAYVDSSVLMRIVLKVDDPLPAWNDIDRGITSAISEVECLRIMDRLRLEAEWTDDEVARAREETLRLLETFEVVQVTEAVITRAAQPMPVVLGALSSIHLATALLWRELIREEPLVATHDPTLGLAARASGFRMVGL